MSVMGLFVCLVLSFCMTDLEAAAADPSGYPAFTLIINHWGENLAFAFLPIVIVNSVLGGASVLFMVSCQTAAFARDGGLVFNDKLAHVWIYSNMPIYSNVLVTNGGDILLFLAMSPMASSIIYSLAVIAVMLMYALPMSFRVFHGGRWVPGPWNYGRFSIPIHVYSIISILYITILECFPPMANWTGATFNYNWVVLIFALFLSGVLWMFKVSYTYKGVDQEALDAWRAQEVSPSTSEDDIEGANIVIQGTSPRGSSYTAGNSVHTVVKGLKN
ncbi:hypothetical protein SNK03_004322 [Fusarium graminearum]